MLASLAIAAALTLQVPAATPVPARTPSVEAQSVRFQPLSVPDGAGPAIEAGVWSPPASTGRAPLIVISHGTGGDLQSHAGTARALASAGFVVAALTHTGDNWRDRSRATDVAERPRQLGVLIDFMLTAWDGRAGIDPERVGAFGFSSGGFTVLTAAGGRPDLTRIVEHCREHPDFYDCRMVASRRGAAPTAWSHDARIRAVVAAAPALGFTFTDDGLRAVAQPVQLWRGGADEILPSPFYAEAVRDALPRPPEYHVVEGARHFDFLPPCSARLAEAAPQICVPTPGFDRAAFHAAFNAELIRFFRETLA
jgi:predicted dienelactone hydrolase